MTLGVVEGITEFLPVSSTGHLILFSRLLNIPANDFSSSFNIAIQTGAIGAVIFLYWQVLLVSRKIVGKVLAAFLPTAVIGLVLYKLIKHFLLNNALIVVWMLFLGGIFIVLFEKFYKEKNQTENSLETITYSQAILIGFCQSLAVVPGVSRAAATIIGGLFLGLKRKTIVEFSFLLAVPTMLAATGLDLLKTAVNFSGQQFMVLAVGFIVSFLVAVLSIKFLLNYIKNHNFTAFGIYRILVAVVFYFLLRETR